MFPLSPLSPFPPLTFCIVCALTLAVFLCLLLGASPAQAADSPMPPLSPDERAVLIDKATEHPFTGEYWDTNCPGIYRCRQCGTPLYRSDDKFDSRCGWPSFDDAFPNAVRRAPDADGRRTEILCASCGGHLGHVFEGEGLTAKNTRHCVNSLSMSFEPSGPAETAYFAGGCFWGVEDALRKTPGVCTVTSGYAGGTRKDPTYREVSTGTTGHAETVRVRFNPQQVSFEQLARVFFEIHDPTQINRQGPDVGSQYRSAIFYTSDAQRDTAQSLLEQLRTKGWKVVTEVTPFTNFYDAEAGHQGYVARTGQGACHIRLPRFEQGPDGK